MPLKAYLPRTALETSLQPTCALCTDFEMPPRQATRSVHPADCCACEKKSQIEQRPLRCIEKPEPEFLIAHAKGAGEWIGSKSKW